MVKNEMAKTRPVNNPYEIYKSSDGWEWRVLKKYQTPENEAKNPYARWFCAVKSPMIPSYDMGDTYISDVGGLKVNFNPETIDKWHEYGK